MSTDCICLYLLAAVPVHTCFPGLRVGPLVLCYVFGCMFQLTFILP